MISRMSHGHKKNLFTFFMSPEDEEQYLKDLRLYGQSWMRITEEGVETIPVSRVKGGLRPDFYILDDHIEEQE